VRAQDLVEVARERAKVLTEVAKERAELARKIAAMQEQKSAADRAFCEDEGAE
jgi:hypothetical protein